MWNYDGLLLALLIPVGIHGLYNFSLSSSIISSEISYLILIIFTIRALILFKNMRKTQNESNKVVKKYYTISINKFISASTNVLLLMLLFTYIINIML